MDNMTPEQIADLVEFGEADAWADFYLRAPQDFAEKFKVEARRIGSTWVTMVPGLDWAFFNRIVGLGVRESMTEAMLDDCIAILENAGCKNYMAQPCPLAQPPALPEWLESRGLKRGRNWAKVYRGAEPAPVVPTDLRIQVGGQENAGDFANIVLTAFEMPSELGPMVSGIIGIPGWYSYLAYDGEQPVSAAAMQVSGDVCWLGFGSTLESHRNRGGQGALFSRRIEDGLKLGCKWFVTEAAEDRPESPNASYHNMIRSGFRLAYQRPNYVHQTPTA